MSLGLDSELSELEQALLAAHLERCGSCREFEAEVCALTAELRAAPLEPLEHPIALPSRSRLPVRAFRAGAAAAAVLAVAVLGSLLGLSGSHSSKVQRIQQARLATPLAFDDEARGLPRSLPKTKTELPRRGLRSGQALSEV